MCKLRFFLCFVFAFGVIAGCASPPTPAERKLTEFSDWRQRAEQREARGELSRVDKLKEMYAQLAKEPVSVADIAGMRWVSSDITTLEALQVGRIDRSEAESRLRQSETAWRADSASRRAVTKPVNTRCVTWQGFTQCATQ
ncbi:hypothetical protein D3C87_1177100 [compost metagenome]